MEEKKERGGKAKRRVGAAQPRTWQGSVCGYGTAARGRAVERQLVKCEADAPRQRRDVVPAGRLGKCAPVLKNVNARVAVVKKAALWDAKATAE